MSATVQAVSRGLFRRRANVRAATEALEVTISTPAPAPRAPRVACPRMPDAPPCALVPLDDVTPQEWEDLAHDARLARERLRRATR